MTVWTNESKNVPSWSNESKGTAPTWTNEDIPTTTITGQSIGLLLVLTYAYMPNVWTFETK
jgi:hypothetical protein